MSPIPVLALLGLTIENVARHLVPHLVDIGFIHRKRLLGIRPGFERDVLRANENISHVMCSMLLARTLARPWIPAQSPEVEASLMLSVLRDSMQCPGFPSI